MRISENQQTYNFNDIEMNFSKGTLVEIGTNVCIKEKITDLIFKKYFQKNIMFISFYRNHKRNENDVKDFIGVQEIISRSDDIDLILLENIEYILKKDTFAEFKKLKELAKSKNIVIISISDLHRNTEKRENHELYLEDFLKNREGYDCFDQVILINKYMEYYTYVI